MNINLKSNPFILLFIIWIFGGTILLFSLSKEDIHLIINDCHMPFFNFFFRYITHIGDGVFIIIISVLALVFYRMGNALIIFSSYITTGILTQLLKRLVFFDALRPVKFFENIAELYIVPGYHPNMYHSFPSGHATSAFAFFLCLSFLSRKKYLKLLCFFMAVIVAYSRVYLSEHFFGDIFVGSTIGVVISLPIINYIMKFNQTKWFNSSLIQISATKNN